MRIGNLFASPKKALATAVCLAAVLAVLGRGTVFAATAIAENSSIGAENAKNFACLDAGIDPASVTVVHTEFEFEHGQFVYEVEFIAGGMKYEYLIKASDGSVVKKEVESAASGGQATAADAKITMDRAKEIALANAGVTTAEASFTEEKLDYDDGILVYELEFYVGTTEYEYEINAVTGAVYSKSKELFQANPGTAGTSAKEETGQPPVSPAQNPENSGVAGVYIGLEKAKEIAAGHAGTALSGITFSRAELEAVYEIEFYKDGVAYEYTIDAVTGRILEYDFEKSKGNAHSDKNSGSSESYIGTEKAKAIAAEHAGVSLSDVFFSEAKFDWDDGRAVYEITFHKGRMEYEYTINALTGAILEYDLDWDD